MSEYLKRTIVKEEVPSRLLNAFRPVKVYLPPGYNELLSYPVVYCQDGNDFFTMGRIATLTNQLILNEGMEPIIIVGVSVERSKRTSEYSAIGERNEAYKCFFVEELLPYIEQRYPVRQDPAARLLAGDSLGGTVSLHLALDYPTVFSRVLSLSGAFFQPTLERIQQETDLSWLQLWMVVGLDETAVETHIGTFDFVDWNRRIKQVLVEKRADLAYVEDAGDHLWGFWQRMLPDGLRHFFAVNDYGS
ncbi:esterase family protein [Brevibacillus humidisoli]|uniref:alpha/beta hydrolase n=1 Tax=Brevibacillus humidisoli TaxID=2895522 RepID=UPI001E55AA4D|nr:alpha/beta hydrolase-fold protein [Brevibacillus humidisoli]UFJ42264.1 esterase family protein [Brevibacillus humidisoli]